MNTEQLDKKLDLLAIGDTVIDAFIRLEEAKVINDNGVQRLAVEYGAKIPYESVDICKAVGNSANGAVSAARLGLKSGLFTYLGKDQNGTDCIDELHINNVDTTYVHIEDGKKTNYHYVLWYDVDRTILIKHELFDYDLGDIAQPKWIYLSSLGTNTLPFHTQISDYLTKNPDVQLAFQPGTFQIKFGTEQLAEIYKETDIFCCNVEEAQTILNIHDTRDIKTLLTKISELGPKTVLITDGMAGAYAYETSSPDDFWFMPIYPHTPYERTGAGDAFFSTVVAALCMGKTLAEALTWGPINSQSVVQQVGAQKGLLTMEKLQEFLAKAPAEYVLKRI